LEDAVWVSGQLEALEEVTVSAEIPGRVSRLARDLGDSVERGQVLAHLDDSSIRARIRKAEARLAQAETDQTWAAKDLARRRDLFARQIAAETTLEASQQRLEEAVNERAVAEAELEEARLDLDRATLESPLSGRVARRHVAVGEYVTPGSQLFDLVRTDRLKLAMALAEMDVPWVAVGDRLEVTLDALAGRSFEAEVRAISPAGHRQTRTFRVELELENPSSELLKPGMSGRARLVRRRFAEAVRVPEEALFENGEGWAIYLIEAGRARRAPVEVLARQGSAAILAGAGLTPGECVIRGQASLEEGTAVEVRRTHPSFSEGARP
jgi:membrane fusion protein (multidrug efflux system)